MHVACHACMLVRGPQSFTCAPASGGGFSGLGTEFHKLRRHEDKRASGMGRAHTHGPLTTSGLPMRSQRAQFVHLVMQCCSLVLSLQLFKPSAPSSITCGALVVCPAPFLISYLFDLMKLCNPSCCLSPPSAPLAACQVKCTAAPAPQHRTVWLLMLHEGPAIPIPGPTQTSHKRRAAPFSSSNLTAAAGHPTEWGLRRQSRRTYTHHKTCCQGR